MKNTNGAYGGNGQVKESETWTVEKLVDEWKIHQTLSRRKKAFLRVNYREAITNKVIDFNPDLYQYLGDKYKK